MTAQTAPTMSRSSVQEQSAEDLAKSYFEHGFVVVPSVLSPQEVQSLRAFLRPKYDLPPEQHYVGDTKQYLFDPFSRYKETRSILLNPRSIQVVTAILGARPALVREFAAQFQNYSGWHKDTSCLERAGLSYHWDVDFSFMTFTCYLQDNDPESGGGLDIAPGSEKWPDRYVDAKPKKQTRPSFWHKLLGKKTEKRIDYGYDIKDYDEFYTIPSKAGDLILFNRKIDHRATVNKTGESKEKFGIFGSFSRNDRHLASYHDFIGHRADYHYLRDFSYPADFIAEAAAAGFDLI